MVTAKMIKYCLSFFFLGLLSLTCHAAELSATVDRDKLYETDSLTLIVRFSGQLNQNGPDFSQLTQQFDILGNNRSNQYRSFNGQIESFTEWQLVLAPKKTGKLLIPSFQVQGAYSDAIEIEILKASNAGGNKNADVFLEAELEKPQIYVQEQVLLTVRLHTAVNLQGFDKQDLIVDNTRVEVVAEHQYRRQVNGRAYIVLEVVYALFPQTSGHITVPSTTWTITRSSRSHNQYDPFNTGRRNIQRLRTGEHHIHVLPKPDSYPDSAAWLPATNITLEQNWNNGSTQFRVGEPQTRTITINAQGLTSAQLPPLEQTSIDGIKRYPDQPKLEDQTASSGVTGIRIESEAIVPTQSGEVTLPAMHIQWWDTVNKKVMKASLPEKTIFVLPAEGSTPTNTQLQENIHQTTPSVQTTVEPAGNYWVWKLGTLFFMLTTLVFFILWWRNKQEGYAHNPQPVHPSTFNEKQAFQQFQQACKLGDPVNTRQTLLLWAQVFWKDSRLTQLNTVAARLCDPEINSILLDLDMAIYGKEKQTARDNTASNEQGSTFIEWNAQPLLNYIYKIRQKDLSRPDESSALPDLYSPTH